MGDELEDWEAFQRRLTVNAYDPDEQLEILGEAAGSLGDALNALGAVNHDAATEVKQLLGRVRIDIARLRETIAEHT